MVDMRVRIMAIFIDSGEQMTYYGLSRKYRERFDKDADAREVRRVASRLCKQGCLIEINPEYDILSNESLSHSEHGELDAKDFHFTLDEILTLGAKAFAFLDENIVELRSAAAEGGLKSAVSIFQGLRIDSTQWTGLPKNASLAGSTLDNMILMLRRADQKIDQAALTNTQAAQAKAYIQSALIIAEAPRPEPDLIWEILQRGSSMASIGQLFLAILQIFKG